MKYLYLSLALIAAIFTTSANAETVNCTEITTIPVVITVQGIYCLKGNLASGLTSGKMIDIQTNNVTIDFNGFKLGGLSAGLGTNAIGIFAENHKNITLRNGAIRGFFRGIQLEQTVASASSGHLIEDMLLDGNSGFGISAEGNGIVIHRNRVVNTGPTNNSTGARGILLNSARNSVIADNVISATSETSTTTGIFVGGSTLIEVRGNTILDTMGTGQKDGIQINASAGVTVIGNSILNDAATGDNGITAENFSSAVKCIDNTITGFGMLLFGCDVAVGNN